MDQVQSNYNRKKFATIIIVLQLFIIATFITLQSLKLTEFKLNDDNYDYYFHITSLSLMIVLGFGLYLATIKKCVWSTLIYTLLIYALSIQLYFIWKILWGSILSLPHKEYTQNNFITLLSAIKSSLPCIIGYGAIIGRISQIQIVIITFIGNLGYTFLETVATNNFEVNDVGGTIFIFEYGAIYGLTISKMINYDIKSRDQDHNNIRIGNQYKYFSVFGAFILWVSWPLFNIPLQQSSFSQSDKCDRDLVISNTFFSLIGSGAGGFIFWFITKKRYQPDQIMYVTLSGAIVAGSSTNLPLGLSVFIFVGTLASVTTCIAFYQLSSCFRKRLGIYDSALIVNSTGLPSILGGCLTIAFFVRLLDLTRQPGINCLASIDVVQNKQQYQNLAINQVLAIIISCASAIICGVIVGLLINYCFSEKQRTIRDCYSDEHHFYIQEFDATYFPQQDNIREEGILQQNLIDF